MIRHGVAPRKGRLSSTDERFPLVTSGGAFENAADSFDLALSTVNGRACCAIIRMSGARQASAPSPTTSSAQHSISSHLRWKSE
jgi:hypothetical protein